MCKLAPKWLLPIVVASTSLAASFPVARAQEAAFSGSTTSIIEWRNDNRNGRADDDNFGVGILRTNMLLDGGDDRASLRFDGMGFVSEPSSPSRRDDLRVERATVELARDLDANARHRLQLTLGDHYAQLGSGLVLSLRRVDELGLDAALRGAHLDLGLFEDQLRLVLLGGLVNVVNVENTFLRFTEDPNDLVGGGRLEVRQGVLTLAGHAAALREARAAAGQPHAVRANYGAHGLVTLEDFSVELEVNRQLRDLGLVTTNGWAAYLAATARLGRSTWLLEAKHYAKFEPLYGGLPTYLENRFAYSFAPTAERIDQEVLDNTDTTGGRLRVDVLLSQTSPSSLHGNVALFENRLLGLWFAHAYGGLDLRGASGSAVLLSGGYRREWFLPESPRAGDLFRALIHGELDWLTPLTKHTALHIIVLHQSWAEQISAERVIFHRGGASAEWDLAGRFTALVGFDWNTQDPRPEIRKRFGYGVVRYRPSDRWFVQLLVGSQRGGIRCIAGACRDFPPFSGIRLDTTVRF